MLEKYLIPVNEKVRNKTVEAQMIKIYNEYNEADSAMKDYYMAENMGKSSVEVGKKKWDFAMEVVDVMVACVTLLKMIDVNLLTIVRAVYEKNKARGYYD